MNTVFPAPTPATLAVTGTQALFPVRRVYCVGRNYADHAREMGSDPTREAPFFFTKPGDTVVGSGQAIHYPSQTQDLHHEVELVIALAQGGRNIPAHEALDCVFGYAVGLDLTRRDLQAQAKAKGRPWCTAKAFDQSAVVGDVTPKSIAPTIDDADIWLNVNNQLCQQGNIRQMIWSNAEIIASLSTLFELQAGDLIFTGTPAGVGALQVGDQLTAQITGLSPLNTSIAPPL